MPKSGQVLYCRGKPEGSQPEHRVGFLFTSLERNLIYFFSITERVASITFEFNERYKLKVAQVHPQYLAIAMRRLTSSVRMFHQF